MTGTAGQCGAACPPPLAVLTRPAGRNEALAARLQAAGWQVLVLPALRIEPIPAERLPHPRDYELVVMVSGNAARLYLDGWTLREPGFAWPPGTAAAVVGPASAAALRASPAWHRDAVIIQPGADARSHDSESLWAAMQARGVAPARVLVVRGSTGRDWLAGQLAQLGARVDKLALYRRVPQAWPDADMLRLRQAADAGRSVHWLFTSAESLGAAREQLAKAGLQEWFLRCPAVVTHERLAALWRQYAADTNRNDGPGGAMVKISLPEDEALARSFLAA